jgi:hypothetical protein
MIYQIFHEFKCSKCDAVVTSMSRRWECDEYIIKDKTS